MAVTKGTSTREKLLDAAEAMILRQGFAATSIEQILDRVGLTKGSFFYHFKTKSHLARALIERYAEGDRRLLRENLARAEKLSRDPLQQLLIFVGLFIEVGEELDCQPQPGCLFASYVYESGLFEPETNAVVSEAMRAWREALTEKLEAIAAVHPPRLDVDLPSLADLMTVIFEGAFVMSRSLPGPAVFSRQLSHYRDYLRLLFGDAA